MYQTVPTTMPRTKKIEQDIINLMDEYAICLTKIIKLDMQVFEAIELLNGDIKKALKEKYPQFDTDVLKDTDVLEYEGLRHCILSLYICGGLDEHLKEGMDSRNAWLAFSKEVQGHRDKITVLNDIAKRLLESFNLLPALVTILEPNDGLQLGQLIRLFNLVERPFPPITVLNHCCLMGLFSTKWKSKGDFEGDDVDIYRLIAEREFINIVEHSFSTATDEMAIFDTSSNLVQVNNVNYTQTTALLFPSLTEEQANNPEYINYLEKQLHLMITHNLRKPAPRIIDASTSDHDFLKFGFPKNNYQRSLVSHKGSIIGFFGAIYAELLRKIESQSVKEAVYNAFTLISQQGFTTSPSTIYRVRKENLSLFRVDSRLKIKTDCQQH
mgnify:CR=1 FL=1